MSDDDQDARALLAESFVEWDRLGVAVTDVEVLSVLAEHGFHVVQLLPFIEAAFRDGYDKGWGQRAWRGREPANPNEAWKRYAAALSARPVPPTTPEDQP